MRWGQTAVAVLATAAAWGAPVNARADQPPQVVFATPRPASAVPCQPVILDASRSYDPDGTLNSVAWGIANGPYGFPIYGPAQPITGDPFGQPPSTPVTKTVTFAQPGNYVLGVQLTDDGGQTASAVQFFDVNPAPAPVPVPIFSQSAVWQYVGHPVSFDASASYVSTFDSSCDPVANHAMSNYTWDFGDGTVVADGSAQTTHAYTTPGLYTVILRVTGPNISGGQAAATHSVLAAPVPPPPPAVVGLPHGSRRVDRHGHLTVSVRCRKAKAGCAGELLLLARKPHSKTKVKPTAVASGVFLTAVGHVQRVTLALTAAGRTWLRAAGKRGLSAQLVAIQLSAAVPLTTATASLTVRPPAGRPKKNKKPAKPRHGIRIERGWPQLRNL